MLKKEKKVVENQNSSTLKRIAMIDVDKIVAKSSEVKKLKADNEKKNKELERWLKNVKKQIEKPESKSVQSKLIKRYESEFKQKKLEYEKEFQENLQLVNEHISSQIIKTAKENDYDIVLSKAVVVCGCDDITDLIAKDIK